MVQNASRCIADFEEDSKERTVLWVGLYAVSQRFSILKWSERTVDSTKYFPKENLVRRSLQLIAAVCAANAYHETCAVQISQDCFQEFLRQLLLLSNVPNLDSGTGILPRKDGQSLQCIQPFLRDPHTV
jgi:hypothetical protein